MTSNPQMTHTLVVNLYGGPGTGKSTTAAAVFALLKQEDINAELATEYAKEIVWEGRNYLLSDQIYIFAKQNRKLVRLYDQVDVVVTDSPLYLSYYYSQNEHILALIQTELQRAQQLHVLLQRKKAYNPKGRTQKEGEAQEIDIGIREMLNKLKVHYHEMDADPTAAQKIVDLVRPLL
jgi:tRNA uridine 5-carbamoylmethylation protein Kti12